MKKEILYGYHSVYEAAKVNRRKIIEICIAKDKRKKRVDELVNFIESERPDISVRPIPTRALNDLAQSTLHQGVAAVASPFPLTDISVLAQQSDLPPFIVLLDSVLDAHNFGALVRTALCMGVHGVVITKDRSAGPTPDVSRISAGALEHIRLSVVTNLVNTIKMLKDQHVWIAGLDAHSGRHIFSSDLTNAVGIVIGGEEKGIRPLIRKHCDFLMQIPQSGELDSLNASVAGAIAMYEVVRQRRMK